MGFLLRFGSLLRGVEIDPRFRTAELAIVSSIMESHKNRIVALPSSGLVSAGLHLFLLQA
jgi:hypothetical protein